MEAKLDEAEWVKSIFDKLNLIDEKCLTTLCHVNYIRDDSRPLSTKRLTLVYSEKVT